MTYRLNIMRFYTPQQSDPILQSVFLPHLFQFHHLWSVPTYDKSDFGEEVAYGRGGCY
jgi:hypothetical protein